MHTLPHIRSVLLGLLALLISSQLGLGQTKLFEENFDSVALGPNVDETAAGDQVWTAEPPAGWMVDNSKMPMANGALIGRTEWRGWTFAEPAWWASVDNQRRSEFTKASGAAAIADPDEWDDVGSPASVGAFESYLVSPNFDVSTVAGSSATLEFDFSWRPEGAQTGNITVIFDGGDAQEILRLNTATTTDTMTNESKSIPFSVPAETKVAKLTFGMFDAGNNWFWAIDNIVVQSSSEPVLPSNLVGSGNPLAKTVTLEWTPAANIVGAIEVLREGVVIAELPIDAASYIDNALPGIDAEGRITFNYSIRVKGDGINAEPLSQEVVYSTGAVMRTLFEENFDSVALGESVEEGAVDADGNSDMVWTAEPPAGWTVDNSKMPMDGGELLGRTEWRGWTFANPIFWANVDDQRRSEFVNASGAIAIADPDEWDDSGNPASVGTFESYLISPPIDVTAEAGGNVTIVFDSSWRPEGNQTGNLTIAFDGAAAAEVLRLSTDTTQDNETNTVKVIAANVPAGAKAMVLTFGLFDAGNNWWWAIDNLLVTTQAVPICPTALTSSSDLAAGTVTLAWQPGANLGAATIEITRNGAVVASVAGDASTFTDTITGVDPNALLIFDYVLTVKEAPEPCPVLTKTVVFSQGAVTKIGQWDFEEGSGDTAANSVVGGPNGTLTDLSPDSWSATNFIGGSLQFEAEGYVDFGTSPEDDATRAMSDALRPVVGITISAWVNPTEFTEWSGIAGSLFDSGSNEGGFYLNTRAPSDFSFALATASDGALTYLRTEGIPGEWQHVVGTYDGEAHKLYLNGELRAERPASGPIDYDPAPYGFQIGTFIDDNEDVRFTGQISQVALWNGALSDEEILLLYQIGETGVSIDPALDTDGDGLLDSWETANFGGITSHSGLDDPDNDQLNNINENAASTDPNKADTDDDGVSDSTEVAIGSSPINANSTPAANAVALQRSNSGTQNWDTAEVWSNGEAPSKGKDYFANGVSAKNLRSPNTAGSAFGGDSLELFDGVQLWVQGTGAVSIPELILKNASLVHGGANGSTVRVGKPGEQIIVAEDSFIFFEQNASTLEIGSSISGAATLALSQDSPFRAKSIEGGTIALLGNNSGFTGIWEIDRITLKVSSSRGLGNADLTLINAKLDPDANLNLPDKTLTLVGDSVKIVLDQQMAFAEVKIGEFSLEKADYTYDDLIALGFSEDNLVDGGGLLVVGGTVSIPEDPDPQPAGSFRITTIAAEGVDAFKVTWTSAADKTYALETSADGIAWQTVKPGIGGTVGETSSSVARDGALRLIRVAEQP